MTNFSMLQKEIHKQIQDKLGSENSRRVVSAVTVPLSTNQKESKGILGKAGKQQTKAGNQQNKRAEEMISTLFCPLTCFKLHIGSFSVNTGRLPIMSSQKVSLSEAAAARVWTGFRNRQKTKTKAPIDEQFW